ncbi:hypothetical protein EZV73_09955 [Acidaminobacter sp. JC074]|uniref:AbrB/MazE/SpoVT family DNA-binding domain-containing protein n=1 Tax=Acidaminobacter sp. JC074 TaxID=2530199 RepID=UPI001F0D9F45|nr:hypothetical protein [Acidaminobacter sp. JC074]MCH4887898.1 hypothetical protein [Acidaminobacter sp. JC074]
MKALGIDDLDQKLKLEVVGCKLIVEKAEDVMTIETLFEGYNGNYKPSQIDWGEPVGREEW